MNHNMNSIDMSNLAPYEDLYNRLSLTLGLDPGVNVLTPVQENETTWSIDITVDTLMQAINLSTITKRIYIFDTLTVYVNFTALDCNERIPSANQTSWDNIGFLSTVYNRALSSNPLYAYNVMPSETFPGVFDIYLYFAPSVVQYFCNNDTDLFGFCNYTAADVFKSILYNKFFGSTTVGFQTNVPTYG